MTGPCRCPVTPLHTSGRDKRKCCELAHALRRDPFTLLNDDTATSPAFSAFFDGAHAAFSLRADAEAETADHHTDTRRRPLLNDPASLRGWFLNDVIVREARRNDESCQSGTGENCSHGKSPSRGGMIFLNSFEAAWFPSALARGEPGVHSFYAAQPVTSDRKTRVRRSLGDCSRFDQMKNR